MRLHRGDIHTHTNFIQREGAATHRLIIASTPIAADDQAATVLTLHVYDTDEHEQIDTALRAALFDL